MKRFWKVGLSGLGLGIAGLVTTVALRSHRQIDAPMPALTASTDPAIIERGRYLAYGPAHCVDCHGAVEAGHADPLKTQVALTGGTEWKLPIGTVRAANITSDPETGIGAMTDGQIARSLRYGVGRHRTILMPFMPFANLGDEDLVAVISFLRSLPPTKKAVRTVELNPLGHVIRAFVLKPEGPTGTPPARVVPAATPEYGAYLANNVANCTGCHTQRDLMTGAYAGPKLAGGMEFESHTVKGLYFKTPNLTPHAKTGRLAGWTEEVFVARFRGGEAIQGTPMPWRSFGRMSDTDLRALYRYLRSVGPVEMDTNPTVRRETEDPSAQASR